MALAALGSATWPTLCAAAIPSRNPSPLPAAPAPAAQAAATSPAASDAIDEVVVSGEQPGPGLWKVSKADHVLWILGTLTPLPQKMVWRSREVEKIVAQSKEVIGQESVKPDIGFFREITLVPSLLRARYNPDGAMLKDVLPPPLYARWLKLKAAYIGNDSGIEKWRPMFAAIRLYQKALDHSDLTQKNIVWPVITKAARANNVHVTNLSVKVDVGNPKETIRDFTQTPRAADVACLAATIERLETELGSMKQRANAWAVGDLAALEKSSSPEQVTKCVEAFTSGPSLHEKLNAGRDRYFDEWLAAAQKALSRNDVTFATLPMSELLGAGGRLSILRSKGYTVENPAP